MAISRIGFGNDGEVETALTSSQIGLPNFGSCTHRLNGPSSAPSSPIAVKPLKFWAMPARMSS
jgi:hypothetical protein